MTARKVSEDIYQQAFGFLAETVQEHAYKVQEESPVLHWYDSHMTSIKRSNDSSRRPDGIFSTHHLVRYQWQNIAAVVEIKGDNMDNDNHHIRGQIIQNFIDMAEIVPRRFMLGLTVAKKGVVKVHVCMPGGIHSAHLGNLYLPGTSKPTASVRNAKIRYLEATNKERNVVAFLLLLYKQSRKDSGYLTGHNFGFLGRFLLNEIQGALLADDNILPQETSLALLDCSGNSNKVYGRHRHLKGQHTWAYPVTYEDTHNRKANAFFKFQWRLGGEEEIDVHRFVLNRSVPHIPRLLYAATMNCSGCGGSSKEYSGEAIITEDVGRTIGELFKSGRLEVPEAQIIDIFAGYVHTLISAATVVNDDRFALHRDISMGNLMVKDNSHPYIIDWGCGRVCTLNEKRISSENELVGTAIYMSIRVLENCGTRSVIDDLESLFLILCHCLWSCFGKRDNYFNSLWSGSDEFSTKTTHGYWLSSKENFINHIRSSDRRPYALLVLVKGMYELLFSGYTIPDICSSKSVLTDPAPDPRVERFELSQWSNIFQQAQEHAGTEGIKMTCLDKLQRYAIKSGNCQISFTTVASPSSPDILGVGSILSSSSSGFKGSMSETSQQNPLSSPTRSGSKRQFNDSFGLAKSKSHVNRKLFFIVSNGKLVIHCDILAGDLFVLDKAF